MRQGELYLLSTTLRLDGGLVVQNDIQQGVMDFQFSIVFDVAQFAELVHEMAYPGPGRSDHLREDFLAEISNDRLRRDLLYQNLQGEVAARAKRFSLELNNWSIRSSSIRLFRFNRVRHEQFREFRLIDASWRSLQPW